MLNQSEKKKQIVGERAGKRKQSRFYSIAKRVTKQSNPKRVFFLASKPAPAKWASSSCEYQRKKVEAVRKRGREKNSRRNKKSFKHLFCLRAKIINFESDLLADTPFFGFYLRKWNSGLQNDYKQSNGWYHSIKKAEYRKKNLTNNEKRKLKETTKSNIERWWLSMKSIFINYAIKVNVILISLTDEDQITEPLDF